MNRFASACFALVATALLTGAMTSCAQLFDLPDGTLADGGDGSSGEAGSEGGTGEQADTGAGGSGDSGADGGPRTDAGGSTPPSDGATSGDAAHDAGESGASEAGSDCAPAALLLYAQDAFNHLDRADFANKKFDEVTTDTCIDRNDPQHLAMTRAGHGWLLGEDGKLHDVDLTSGNCSDLGTVKGGENFDDMAIAFARAGGATTDTLYTCSPDGFGTIDQTTFAWTFISDLTGIDHSLGCTIKQGRDGRLAILASTNTGDSPEYTLYEIDATGAILFSKGFGTAITDNGYDNTGFDFAWSSSLYYLYGEDVDNSSTISTYDPVTGDINGSLFDFTGNALVTAAQSTCAQ